MPAAAKEQANKELDRLERMGEQSGESSMIRTYLDWLISVPWSNFSQEHLDPIGARAVLDVDHAGLDHVKDRITEYLAVRKLREERGMQADPKAGAILTLIGPPGTGKTSIGESVAKAMGESLSGFLWEVSVMRPRSEAIAVLTLGPCLVDLCVRCAMPKP